VHVSDYNPDTTEYWISVDATDEGTGTIDDPYTIDAALSHTVNGDTLYFLPGTYNTRKSFLMKLKERGSSLKPKKKTKRIFL